MPLLTPGTGTHSITAVIVCHSSWSDSNLCELLSIIDKLCVDVCSYGDIALTVWLLWRLVVESAELISNQRSWKIDGIWRRQRGAVNVTIKVWLWSTMLCMWWWCFRLSLWRRLMWGLQGRRRQFSLSLKFICIKLLTPCRNLDLAVPFIIIILLGAISKFGRMLFLTLPVTGVGFGRNRSWLTLLGEDLSPSLSHVCCNNY